MIREHYAAVKALIPSTVRVHMWSAEERDGQGNVVPLKYPYVVLWGSLGEELSGDPDGPSLANVPDSLDFRMRATYVGLNGDSMLIVARNVRTALSGKKPVVAGWKPSALRQSTLLDGQTDFDVTVNSSHPVYAVDQYTFTSFRH